MGKKKKKNIKVGGICDYSGKMLYLCTLKEDNK